MQSIQKLYNKTKHACLQKDYMCFINLGKIKLGKVGQLSGVSCYIPIGSHTAVVRAGFALAALTGTL